MKVIVKRGRTVVLGRTVKGKAVKENHPEFSELDVSDAVGKALIDSDHVVRAGTQAAAATKAMKDVIQADFPHADLLAANGIETFSALRSIEDLTELENIGEGRAEEILEALPDEE